jgi:hypothetical protein
VVIACAAACGTTDDTACDPAELTVGQRDLVDDALDIGIRQNGEFAAIADDAEVELVLGSQGGWMVVPMIRVVDPSIASDVACGRVRLEVSVGTDLAVDYANAILFEAHDGVLDSSDLPTFLSLDLEALDNQPFELRATADIGDYSAVATVAGTLVNRQ